MLGNLKLEERRYGNSGVALSMFMYSSCIRYVGKCRRWEEAVGILQSIRDQGRVPDSYCLNDTVNACAIAGKWRKVVALLQESQNLGPGPDLMTFGAAIKACSRAGVWNEALSLLKEMAPADIPPNAIVYNSAITACGNKCRQIGRGCVSVERD